MLIAGALLLTSACATPRGTAEDQREDADVLPSPAVQLSDYEDFDASRFQEEAPAGQGEVQHDVPAALMDGRSAEPVSRTVQGFRIQVYSSLDKSAAFNQEEDAKSWLRDQEQLGDLPPSLSDGSPPVYTVYIQPYYRVRIGNFTTRSEADRARNFLSQRYSDAFIVPDQVTVTR